MSNNPSSHEPAELPMPSPDLVQQLGLGTLGTNVRIRMNPGEETLVRDLKVGDMVYADAELFHLPPHKSFEDFSQEETEQYNSFMLQMELMRRGLKVSGGDNHRVSSPYDFDSEEPSDRPKFIPMYSYPGKDESLDTFSNRVMQRLGGKQWSADSFGGPEDKILTPAKIMEAVDVEISQPEFDDLAEISRSHLVMLKEKARAKRHGNATLELF